MLTLDEAIKFAEEYRRMLHEIKRKGLDLGSAPKEVQEAALALHQNALLVHNIQRVAKKQGCPHCHSTAPKASCDKCTRDMCENCIHYADGQRLCGSCLDGN